MKSLALLLLLSLAPLTAFAAEQSGHGGGTDAARDLALDAQRALEAEHAVEGGARTKARAVLRGLAHSLRPSRMRALRRDSSAGLANSISSRPRRPSAWTRTRVMRWAAN